MAALYSTANSHFTFSLAKCIGQALRNRRKNPVAYMCRCTDAIESSTSTDEQMNYSSVCKVVAYKTNGMRKKKLFLARSISFSGYLFAYNIMCVFVLLLFHFETDICVLQFPPIRIETMVIF